MSGRYLEDYLVGEKVTSGSFELTRAELLNFAHTYDPQPMHIDEKFAVAKGPFDDVIASGFQTVAIAFKLVVQCGFFRGDVALGGPGMDSVRWLVPVYPGDVLTNHITVMEVRRSRSKPDRGMLTLSHNLMNQNNLTVLTCTTVSMVRSRYKPT